MTTAAADIEEINKAFEAYGCPGAEKCERAKEFEQSACRDCKAPRYLWVNGTKAYRSYADYCDD